MKKFKFSLQTVHDVREMRREQEQMKLADLQLKFTEAKEKLAEAEALRQKTAETYSEKLGANDIDAFEMDLTMKFLNVLYHRENEARERLAEIKQSCRNQSRRVADAAQSLEITEKLRRKQILRHQNDVTRAEQTEIDELVSTSFAKKTK